MDFNSRAEHPDVEPRLVRQINQVADELASLHADYDAQIIASLRRNGHCSCVIAGTAYDMGWRDPLCAVHED